jgi:hypothetical protein
MYSRMRVCGKTLPGSWTFGRDGSRRLVMSQIVAPAAGSAEKIDE